jgi:hypothetical protein
MFSLHLNAQKGYLIKGQMCDSISLKDIPYATVSLTKSDDSDFIKKLAADLEGKFEINIDSIGSYQISIESIGYSKWVKSFTIEDNLKITDLGKIHVSEFNTALNSVTVIGTLS